MRPYLDNSRSLLRVSLIALLAIVAITTATIRRSRAESNPEQPASGTPAVTISGRVSDGTNGIYNATVNLFGTQSSEVRTDANGDFTFTNVPVSANVTVSASAVGFNFSPSLFTFSGIGNNEVANFTGTPGPAIAPDPNINLIYSQAVSANLQMSSKQVVGLLTDVEAADDFNVTGTISRVVVGGGRSFNTPQNPRVRGAYLRFFDGSAILPGQLLAEYYFAQGSPNLRYDPASPAALDFTLPSPFVATGKYFISAQLVIDDGSWFVLSSEHGPTRGSTWVVRDNTQTTEWTSPFFPKDMAFDLYGTLTSPATITSITPQTIERSGWITIKGANFGANQNTTTL
jgi:hypothetical protein